jgi:UV DNA damage repair endonuclease
MPEAYRRAPWIEVEAKSKELAIERLRDEWLGGSEGLMRKASGGVGSA